MFFRLALFVSTISVLQACIPTRPPGPTTPAPCPSCADIPRTTTKPTQVQTTQYFAYSTGANGCKTITNTCPAGSHIRYVTSSGTKFVASPSAQSQQPMCTATGWMTTVDGQQTTVKEEVCYAARCADCPTPTLAPGVTTVVSFDEEKWCKVATFSGCAKGYRFQNGPMFVNINNPLQCVDYGESFGGRWFTPLAANTLTVSCRP